MSRLVVSLLAAFLVTGCSNLMTTLEQFAEAPQAKTSPRPPAVFVAEARSLREEGKWSQAVAVMERAARQHPENAEILRLREDLEQAWLAERQIVDSNLVLIEAAAQLKSLALLKQLAQGDPEDPFLQSRILYHEHTLMNKREELVDCGVRYEETNTRLARRCLVIANRIKPSKETSSRLTAVSLKIDRMEQAAQERQEKRVQATLARKEELVEKQKSERVQQLIAEAERESRQGALTNAMPLLMEALKQDPENFEVRRLVSETQIALENQANVLIKLGDRLYRDEQLGPAIAVWGAALKLDPARVEIADKLERARRVYAKLESIRAGTSESAAGGVDWLDNP